MEMQDKEFDQLFNSKLNDFEAEPSEEVWQNIARELGGKKAKRSIMPYLSIAASIVVIASLSIWLFNKEQEKAQHPVKLVKRVKPFKPQADTNESSALGNIDEETVKETTTASTKIKTGSDSTKPQIAEQVTQEAAIALPSAMDQKPEPAVAVVTTEKPTLTQLMAPGNDIGLGMATLVNKPKEIIEVPDTYINDPTPEKAPSKKRARGLGGLINTIVAAVDKREDKLIEFTDADNDEGSRVTGVNLGILKIKKQ
jgi:hypothetical protein